MADKIVLKTSGITSMMGQVQQALHSISGAGEATIYTDWAALDPWKQWIPVMDGLTLEVISEELSLKSMDGSALNYT